MKKYFVLVMAVLLMTFANNAGATVMLSRSAGVMKPMQAFGLVAASYYQTNKTYDWTNETWRPLADTLRTNTLKADVMVGLCLVPKLELLGVVPLASLANSTTSGSGVGDMWISLRYGLLGGILPVKLTLQGAVVLPTAPSDKPYLGDKTTDIGVGFQFNTIRFGPVAVHARAAYWLQDVKADSTKVGNMMEYIVFPDLAINKKTSVYLGIAGASKTDNELNGTPVPNSLVTQNNINAGIVWNPIGPLYLKPKAAYYLTGLSKGSVLPDLAIGLDLWAVVP